MLPMEKMSTFARKHSFGAAADMLFRLDCYDTTCDIECVNANVIMNLSNSK